VAIIVSMIMSISNVKSNTAAAAVFIPVIGNLAILNGWPPLPILFGITIATSLAFILPMGTPPNALVYERAKITVKTYAPKGNCAQYYSDCNDNHLYSICQSYGFTAEP
jgi:solute carrier family 13 (sodium-dependent dicarboxylate transporter), member 2/3/5